MKLITKAHMQQLLANGSPENRGKDHKPVVKLFTPDANATWLITEADPDDPDILFGLCDLGLGFPELGGVSLSEIKSVRGRMGLPVERDMHFTAKYPLSVYTDAARHHQGIVTSPHQLQAFAPEEADE